MIHFPCFACATKRLAAMVAALTVGLACFAFAGSATPGTAFASTAPTSVNPVVSGNAWLYGQGVPVCYPVGDNCIGVTIAPGESTNDWQCVELAARLYDTKQWVSSNLLVPYAYQMDSNWAAKYGLQFRNNGSGYVPVPGDLIIVNTDGGNLATDPAAPGHVSVVSDPVVPSEGVVHTVEENYSSTGRADYKLVGSTISRPGDGRAVLGTIHAPANRAAWNGAQGLTAVTDGRQVLNHLNAGSQLLPGQYLLSSDARAYLVLQYDGNLVEYSAAAPADASGNPWLWASGTHDPAVAYATVEGGNLVLVRNDGTRLWQTHAPQPSGDTLFVQEDGNLVIYNTKTDPIQPVWSGAMKITADGYFRTVIPGTPPSPFVDLFGRRDRVFVASYNFGVWYPVLNASHFLRSTDGRFALLLKNNGDLVLYGPGYHVLWNSNTGDASDHSGDYARLKSDGNFVRFSPNGSATSLTRSEQPTTSNSRMLVLRPDGNLVIYTDSTATQAIWSTGTNGV